MDKVVARGVRPRARAQRQLRRKFQRLRSNRPSAQTWFCTQDHATANDTNPLLTPTSCLHQPPAYTHRLQVPVLDPKADPLLMTPIPCLHPSPANFRFGATTLVWPTKTCLANGQTSVGETSRWPNEPSRPTRGKSGWRELRLHPSPAYSHRLLAPAWQPKTKPPTIIIPIPCLHPWPAYTRPLQTPIPCLHPYPACTHRLQTSVTRINLIGTCRAPGEGG